MQEQKLIINHLPDSKQPEYPDAHYVGQKSFNRENGIMPSPQE